MHRIFDLLYWQSENVIFETAAKLKEVMHEFQCLSA